MLIPYSARVLGIYYRIKHGEAMMDAIWKMANA
jgi:hypothetical protein